MVETSTDMRDGDWTYFLTPERYLELGRADAAALVAAARAVPAAAVAGCPGWKVTDLVDHVAMVYAHKSAALEQGRPPSPWPPDEPDPDDVFAFFDAAASDLFDRLTALPPEQTAWSWFAPEQTVAFWQRRMAQETAVHRRDAELASGATTPIDPELAVDGIDEILGWFRVDWGMEPVDCGSGSVAIEAGAARWWVEVTPARIVPHRGVGSADPAARVAGDPEAVLWWLWRGDSAGLTVEGDHDLMDGVRAHLSQAAS